MATASQDGRVSVWVGFDRHPPDVDLLRDLCGVPRYDLDSQEVVVDDRQWRRQPIEALLGQLSYSDSFRSDALAAAGAREITEALYVVAQYDYVYNPKRVRRAVAPDPMFLGCFRWTDDEE
jgi:hypothetical protein